MKNGNRLGTLLTALAVSGIASVANAEETIVVSSEVIGNFTGDYAPLHTGNTTPPIAYYGTDLGFTYKHGNNLRFMFGDTWATESGDPIQASTFGIYDDAFGTVDVSATSPWRNSSGFSAANMPPILLGQTPFTSEARAYNPGHPLEYFKTPVGGWSNGSREFGIFYTSKPEGCTNNGYCDNHRSDLTCDTGLGFFGNTYSDPYGFTGGCMDGQLFCLPDTMSLFGLPVPGSGFCRDNTSTIYGASDTGRLMSIGLKHRVGMRSQTDDRSYGSIKEWLTNKFVNVSVGTVQSFIPANGSGHANQNYNPAGTTGANRRVFLWGRPGYIGNKSRSRTVGLYFAYVTMPSGSTFSSWTVSYFKQMNGTIPVFTTNEREAAALDLDSATAGIQSNEIHDVVNQTSVVWVDHIKKWVLFYGGGATNLPTDLLPTCGVVEFFLGSEECDEVDLENGSVYMRTANDPWGPWTSPAVVETGGRPSIAPPEELYAPGGILRHPDCVGATCANHTDADQLSPDEYGFLYGANIIQPWLEPIAGTNDVNVVWNASTWDPYRVVLMRTKIRKNP